jgi:hypothetical protein
MRETPQTNKYTLPMKSLLKQLFAFGLIAHLAGALSLEAEEPSHVWLKETFEDAELGTTPVGWSLDLPDLMTASIVPNPEGGKALSLEKPDADGSPMLSGPLFRDVPESGIVCVKASVMAISKESFGTMVFQAPGGTNNVFMNVGRSPALISEDGGFIRLPVKFEANQWVNLLFRIDLDAKTYDAFVNGEPVASKVGYGSIRPRRKAYQIQFLVPSSFSGAFLLDNLEIMEGDVAPDASLKEKQQ